MSPVWNVKRTRCYKNSFFLTPSVVVALFVLHFFWYQSRFWRRKIEKKPLANSQRTDAIVGNFSAHLFWRSPPNYWYWIDYFLGWCEFIGILFLVYFVLGRKGEERIQNINQLCCVVPFCALLWWSTGRQTHNNILFNNRLNWWSANCHVLRPINPFVWGFFPMNFDEECKFWWKNATFKWFERACI